MYSSWFHTSRVFLNVLTKEVNLNGMYHWRGIAYWQKRHLDISTNLPNIQQFSPI